MITVHHLGVSQSERIVWLFEELEIPYQLQRYARDPLTQLAPAEYKKLHPLGTAPILTDGDLVLPESGAIVEYIIRRYGDGRLAVRSDAANFADYLFWFHFANASMMPYEMLSLVAARIGGGADPTVKALTARSESAYALVEQRLARQPYFAGAEFTAADIMMLFPLSTMRAFTGRDLGPYPSIRTYLQRIGDRPGYRRAMTKGDPGRKLPIA